MHAFSSRGGRGEKEEEESRRTKKEKKKTGGGGEKGETRVCIRKLHGKEAAIVEKNAFPPTMYFSSLLFADLRNGAENCGLAAWWVGWVPFKVVKVVNWRRKHLIYILFALCFFQFSKTRIHWLLDISFPTPCSQNRRGREYKWFALFVFAK